MVDATPRAATVDLLWIPLGAGAHVVRLSGRVYERIAAFVHRRPRLDLYHSALEVAAPTGSFVIEQAPVPDRHGDRRGVVANGPVGMRWLGRFRIFRYEVRLWRDGTIPDASAAVGTVRITEDPVVTQRILDTLPAIPTPIWGRDQLDTGEMWNSNSIISWVLTRSGVDIDRIQRPIGGRAPGWDAGIAVARRDVP